MPCARIARIDNRSRRRRTRNSLLSVSQCEDSIQKWLRESQSADPVHAFDFAAVKWTKYSSPEVRHPSGVGKDFLNDIPLRRGSPSSGKGGPQSIRKMGHASHGTGVHVTRMMAPIGRKLGPSPSEKGARRSEMVLPVPLVRGQPAPREMGTRSSFKRYAFLGNGLHVSRKG